ncbi:hypothetical protein [Paenibacillus sp. DR312]|uniref:hypothetical protein n=1 Tax=Paenibacillus sp. DR312 TaxID=2871175 RepID=UPI001C9846D1|nr:hypothetical protein [Paenibacillus sp. DR312]QZN75460.1 hypothetical protein K5K90_29565 [Paenibacillus sp. DR312]
MGVFSSTWNDGKIDDIDQLILENWDREFMLVIDTNFAIMARYYITDREGFNKYYKSLKDDFVKIVHVVKNNASRVIYALACEEASRSKLTGNIDPDKYRVMVNCLSELFNLDFRNDLLSDNELITEDLKYSKTPLLLKNGLFSHQTVITFTTILKAYLLKNFDDRDKKIRIKEMFHYMADEINAFSPVSTSFVIHYLGGDSNILKNTSPSIGLEKILNKLYAASIDMLMPTQASQLAEISGYEEVPIFITFDKGVKLLFDSLFITGEHRSESGKKVPEYSTKIFYSSGWKDADIIELCQYAQNTQRSNRKLRNTQTNELIRLHSIADKLEKELKSKFIL